MPTSRNRKPRKGAGPGPSARRPAPKSAPLSDDELARLDEWLDEINPDGSMLLEELDGFFAALAAGPQPVHPENWLPDVLGREPDEPLGLEEHPQAVAIRGLLVRHLASIRAALKAGEGYSPLLTHDDEGQAQGNLWAIGFLRGTAMFPDEWDALEDVDDFDEVWEPFMALADELDPETGDVTNPIAPEDRQSYIDAMMQAVFDFHAWFLQVAEDGEPDA